MTAIIPSGPGPAPGDVPDPDRLAALDPANAADVLAALREIRSDLDQIEGLGDGMAAASPAFSAGRAYGRRHVRGGAR